MIVSAQIHFDVKTSGCRTKFSLWNNLCSLISAQVAVRKLGELAKIITKCLNIRNQSIIIFVGFHNDTLAVNLNSKTTSN